MFILDIVLLFSFCSYARGSSQVAEFSRVTIENDQFFELAELQDIKSELICAFKCMSLTGTPECLAFQLNSIENKCGCGLVDFDNHIFNPNVTELKLHKKCLKYQNGKT